MPPEKPPHKPFQSKGRPFQGKGGASDRSRPGGRDGQPPKPWQKQPWQTKTGQKPAGPRTEAAAAGAAAISEPARPAHGGADSERRSQGAADKGKHWRDQPKHRAHHGRKPWPNSGPNSGPKPKSSSQSSSEPQSSHQQRDKRTDAAGQLVAAKDRPFRICGLPAVAAAFATTPERIERLYFEPGIGSRAGAFCKTLAAAHKPYKQVPPEELAKIAGTPMHGSIVALVAPKPLAVLDRAQALEQAKAWAKAGEPLLVLDAVSNPHNLGAIARTAAFFGVKRILVSDAPAQALPSDAAYRVARGGLDHIELLQARDFQAVIRALSPSYRVIGAALGDGQPPEAYARSLQPLALVMGNEEHGLSAESRAACTGIVTIPGAGSVHVQSLNVAASAAILIQQLLQPRAAFSRTGAVADSMPST